jgi:hypothetical protein
MVSYATLTVRALAEAVQAQLDTGRSFVDMRLGASCAQMIKRLVNGTHVARIGRGAHPRGDYTENDVALIDAYAERYMQVKDL